VKKVETKCWKDILQNKFKEEEDQKKDLVLVGVKESEDCRCGICDNKFKVETYYSSGKLRQRVICEHCGTEFWAKP
jgi:transposase-like protein